MEFKIGIRIGLIGTALEAVGMLLDIMHHLQIGMETPEGLLTLNHALIFIGFIVNFIGVLLTLKSRIRSD